MKVQIVQLGIPLNYLVLASSKRIIRMYKTEIKNRKRLSVNKDLAGDSELDNHSLKKKVKREFKLPEEPELR